LPLESDMVLGHYEKVISEVSLTGPVAHDRMAVSGCATLVVVVACETVHALNRICRREFGESNFAII
jgi:hypothetical protein